MSETSAADANRPNVALTIALGVVALLVFGVFGAAAWLAFVWLRMPRDTRAHVSRAKRNVVVAVIVVTIAAGVAGLAATIVQLVHVFGAVASVRPEDKATLLSAGIAEAMSAASIGLALEAAGAVVAFVAGVRLLRAP